MPVRSPRKAHIWECQIEEETLKHSHRIDQVVTEYMVHSMPL